MSCWDNLFFALAGGQIDYPTILKDCSRNQADYLCPDDDVHIYLLSGIFPARSETLLGPSFIGNWVEGESSFLFFSERSDGVLSSALQGLSELKVIDRFHFSYRDWQGGGIEPLGIGSFLILPPWETHELDERFIPMRLDPGVVFGNALHPTTRDCLLALSLARERAPLSRVLDLGTGTGVLALAAALLGAGEVKAVDLNPLCVKTAEKNVRLNALGGRVKVFEGTAEGFLDHPCDLVVANLHHEVISSLVRNECFIEKPRVIVSGLLRSQWREVRERLVRSRFNIVREWDQDMTWYTALAENQAFRCGGYKSKPAA